MNGKLHRIDGPAVEGVNGHNEWWIDGAPYTFVEAGSDSEAEPEAKAKYCDKCHELCYSCEAWMLIPSQDAVHHRRPTKVHKLYCNDCKMGRHRPLYEPLKKVQTRKIRPTWPTRF